MKYLVTGTEMKLLDNNTSDYFHVPSVVLMEQAAIAFVNELLELKLPLRKGIVFCGFGNNGGDGIAIARLLNERGIYTEVCYLEESYQISSRYSELCAVQKKIYDTYGFPVVNIRTAAYSKNDRLQEISENVNDLNKGASYTSKNTPQYHNLLPFSDTYDFIIDAIFGTGLSRPLNAEYVQVIKDINAFSGLKIAVDIPSGICADNGKVLGVAVECDYTITFSFEKIGQFLWPGNEYVGKLICTPIGITQKSWLTQKPSVVALEPSDLCHLPKRHAHSNKGTYGKLLIIAGTKNMAGAAILAAKSAYRMGAGLVKIYTCEENRTILQTAVPEAILATYEQAEKKDDFLKQIETFEKEKIKNFEKTVLRQCFEEYDEEQIKFEENSDTDFLSENSYFAKSDLKEHLAWADAVVLGPGIGTSDFSKELVLEVLKNVQVPLLLDADALNILSKRTSHEDVKDNTIYNRKLYTEQIQENQKTSSKILSELFSLASPIVITPHLGEMSRLTQKSISEIQENLIETATEFAQNHHVTCVLKDFHTVIACENTPVYLNLSGNNGMATAGSGDVLTGIIGTLLAQGIEPQQAAAYGVFLHGLAGDMTVKKTGTHGMCAQDIIEGLKEIWNKVEQNENQ